MRSLLVILIFLATSSLAIFIWGYSLSAIYEVTVKVTINAPIDKVWGIMTDWEYQTEWRKEISKVDMKEGAKFIEYPKKGPPIEFEIICLEKPKYFELSMAGAVEGNYSARLSFHNGITSIIAKEKVINSSIFSRIISSIFFDLEKFAKNYLSQLKEYAERT